MEKKLNKLFYDVCHTAVSFYADFYYCFALMRITTENKENDKKRNFA